MCRPTLEALLKLMALADERNALPLPVVFTERLREIGCCNKDGATFQHQSNYLNFWITDSMPAVIILAREPEKNLHSM